MKELNLNEISEVTGSGTCRCSSDVIWRSCPNQNACYSFCIRHGGMRAYWGADLN
ncbi:hypothetical protein NF27_KH00020 [Candidatus Jidaibacter acanthamoeba]|uniref:Bacteriocin n=1 Tax=Candidatus Jidaibacter acanthamoebae TaxID=86105 RepID=A0A0C1QVM2_9RICK|nr:hypothetical protein NF27_KH00020 [Candidatus Jidaibacter acanthamoeba]